MITLRQHAENTFYAPLTMFGLVTYIYIYCICVVHINVDMHTYACMYMICACICLMSSHEFAESDAKKDPPADPTTEGPEHAMGAFLPFLQVCIMM